MYEKLKGIVLNTVRYSDRHNIVHIYTDGRGLMSFAVPLGKTNAARMRNAMLMPLSLVDLEAGMRSGRDLAILREVRRNYPLATIYSDPVKNAIGISELNEERLDEALDILFGEKQDNGNGRFVGEAREELEKVIGRYLR